MKVCFEWLANELATNTEQQRKYFETGSNIRAGLQSMLIILLLLWRDFLNDSLNSYSVEVKSLTVAQDSIMKQDLALRYRNQRRIRNVYSRE